MTRDKKYGSGPSLDENFDFIVGPSGDLKNADGINEVEKDLAFATSVQLQEFIGRPLTPTVRQKVKNAAEEVFEAEPRIDSLVGISIQETEYGFDLTSQVVTDGSQKSFIIPVGEFE